MIRLKRKKTYSYIFTSLCLIAALFLGVFANLGAVNQSIVVSYSGASLSGSQSGVNIYNFISTFLTQNSYSLFFWIAIAIVITLVGFFSGRLIDIRRSEYECLTVNQSK